MDIFRQRLLCLASWKPGYEAEKKEYDYFLLRFHSTYLSPFINFIFLHAEDPTMIPMPII